MLTILHAADFHLDSPFAGLSPQQAAVRRGEQRALLTDLVTLVHRARVDAVLLSGDLLDGDWVYPQTIRALSACLEEMACPVFLAPGNHDPLTPDSPYLTRKWPENVHIFSTDVEKIPLPELNCVVYGRGFGSAHEHTSPLQSFHVERSGDTVSLMCLHADLTPNSSYCPITPEEIAQTGLTYLALGHIHRPSGVRKAGDTWYAYPGCPQGRGFDETGERGALLLRFDEGVVEEKFIPLSRRRYEVLEVDITGREPLSAIDALLPPDTAPHAYRIILRGESGGVDLAALNALLSPRFDYLSLTDATRLPRNLWDRSGEDDLTGAFLERMAQLCRQNPEDEVYQLAVRFGLAALEGGEDPAP